MTQTPPGRPPWPELDYDAFAPTMRLVHMGLQMVGKLTLLKPFEPQWANVAKAGWDPAWICSGRPEQTPTGDRP